jgi:hypothetical protein
MPSDLPQVAVPQVHCQLEKRLSGAPRHKAKYGFPTLPPKQQHYVSDGLSSFVFFNSSLMRATVARTSSPLSAGSA